MKKPNELIHESSPYLLQHAHNPVNWIAWDDHIFERAQREQKLVLISVGYSACHWCHVMEHESFENEEVAELMNAHFICVKVDREERPDVDQLYMTAVQLMNQHGGWPLNCFTLPDGRPIYGGTYYPKEQWMHILKSLQHLFTNERERAEEYAQQLFSGISKSELITVPQEQTEFENERLHELVVRWKRQFDSAEGGNARAPKFPMPNNYQFLLHYGKIFDDERTMKHVELTLDKMAMGGIYDQVGGGFARYSVDMLWKVPHFEKMLYDNAQLISLYAHAYAVFKKPLYKRIVQQTITWLEREMLHKEGAFYAALDADSDGEEGKFYRWTLEEYKDTLREHYSFANDLYNFNAKGHWEDGYYIPLRSMNDREIMHKYQLTADELEIKIAEINLILREERKKRIYPGIDDKLLTSWNALLSTALSDAFAVFGEEEYKHLAHKIVRWISNYQLQDNGKLYRTRKNEISKIDGFLEDYACTIQAFIRYYEVSSDEQYLHLAKQLTEYCISNFQHEESKMFYFTSHESSLIARKMDLNDDVIPSGNSIMAINLWKLGLLFEKNEWNQLAKQQLANVYDGMETYGSMYSNWGNLLLYVCNPYYEIVFSGQPSENEIRSLLQHYLPHVVVAYSSEKIPLARQKDDTQKWMYICSEEIGCLPPMSDVKEVLKEIEF